MCIPTLEYRCERCGEYVQVVPSILLPWALEVPVCECISSDFYSEEDISAVLRANLNRARSLLEELLDKFGKKVPVDIEVRAMKIISGQEE